MTNRPSTRKTHSGSSTPATDRTAKARETRLDNLARRKQEAAPDLARRKQEANGAATERAANARKVLMTKTARKYETKHVEALRLIGYTVIPPGEQSQ